MMLKGEKREHDVLFCQMMCINEIDQIKAFVDQRASERARGNGYWFNKITNRIQSASTEC